MAVGLSPSLDLSLSFCLSKKWKWKFKFSKLSNIWKQSNIFLINLCTNKKVRKKCIFVLSLFYFYFLWFHKHFMVHISMGNFPMYIHSIHTVSLCIITKSQWKLSHCTGLAILKKKITMLAWVERKRGHLYQCWWKCSTAIVKSSMEVLKSPEIELPYDSAVSLLGSQRNKIQLLQRCLHSRVHCSMICNSQEMKIT